MNINIYEEFAKQAKRFTTRFQKRDFLADKARFLEEEVAKKSPKYTQKQLQKLNRDTMVFLLLQEKGLFPILNYSPPEKVKMEDYATCRLQIIPAA